MQQRPITLTVQRLGELADQHVLDAGSFDTPASFALDAYGTRLVVHPAPTGSQGYVDLRRDATEVPLDEDPVVRVASLVDLVRIAQASEDRARVPALRRTLELATAPPAARAA